MENDGNRRGISPKQQGREGAMGFDFMDDRPLSTPVSVRSSCAESGRAAVLTTDVRNKGVGALFDLVQELSVPPNPRRIKVAAIVSPSERGDTPGDGRRPSRVLEHSAEDRVSIGMTERLEQVQDERAAGALGMAKLGCRDRPALDGCHPSGSPCRDSWTSLSCSTRKLPGPALRRPSAGPRRVHFEPQTSPPRGASRENALWTRSHEKGARMSTKSGDAGERDPPGGRSTGRKQLDAVGCVNARYSRTREGGGGGACAPEKTADPRRNAAVNSLRLGSRLSGFGRDNIAAPRRRRPHGDVSQHRLPDSPRFARDLHSRELVIQEHIARRDPAEDGSDIWMIQEGTELDFPTPEAGESTPEQHGQVVETDILTNPQCTALAPDVVIPPTSQSKRRKAQRQEGSGCGDETMVAKENCFQPGRVQTEAVREDVESSGGELGFTHDFSIDGQQERSELVRVRGLCRLRGAILALVEWRVVDLSGVESTELSFMLTTSLKEKWPQQYISYLEAKLVFEEEGQAFAGTASGSDDPDSPATKTGVVECRRPGEG